VIVYGCCTDSWRDLVELGSASSDRPMMAVSGHTSICVAYNKILDYYRGWSDLEALVLVHDDLEITDTFFEDKLRAALAEDVAIVGVCGGPVDSSLAWWDAEGCIGHQATDSGLIDFGPREGDVAIVDGSIMALSPWVVANLRFGDYPGFHGYPAICRDARAAGRRVVVADIDTHHHTRVGWKSDEIKRSFTVTDWMYQEQGATR
jgi:Glycosyltransferase like family